MDGDIVIRVRKLRGSYKVELESGEAFRVPLPLMRLYPLRAGETIDPEVYLGTIQGVEYPHALERAVKLLSLRDYSMHMILQKLEESAYSQEAAQRVVDYLENRGFLDDRRFADNLLRRHQNKSGSRKIAQELRRNGIAGDVSEEALAQRPAQQELDSAVALIKRYLGSKQLEPRDAYRRALAFLGRRGYGYEIAKQAYQMAAGEGEEEEDDDSFE